MVGPLITKQPKMDFRLGIHLILDMTLFQLKRRHFTNYAFKQALNSLETVPAYILNSL